jgi:hypothetical protein
MNATCGPKCLERGEIQPTYVVVKISNFIN